MSNESNNGNGSNSRGSRGSAAARGQRAQGAQPAQREEEIDGRIVVFPVGEDAYYRDNGALYIPERHAAMRMLTGGRPGGELGWNQLRKLEPANPSILYWMPEYMGGEGQDEPTKNPIRGIVLQLFPRPAILRRNDKPGPDGKLKPRWCAFVLLTDETRVKNRDKKVIVAKPGQIVWIDLAPAISTEMRKKFAPKTIMFTDEKTGLVSERTVQVFEIGIDPKFKQAFPMKDGTTGQVWRMNLYRVPRATIGIEEIKQIKALINPPSVPSDDDDLDERDMDALFESPELPALPPAGGTSSTTEPAAAEAAVAPAS